MPTLDAFLTDVRACTRCAPHLPHGVQPVFQFHPSASILIAGQAPGARVHASGVPFDDASGARLRAWLGVDRDTFYDPTRIAILPLGYGDGYPRALSSRGQVLIRGRRRPIGGRIGMGRLMVDLGPDGTAYVEDDVGLLLEEVVLVELVVSAVDRKGDV